MQPTLPKGFRSWTQVLIDWAVRRAYLQTRRPPTCFAKHPELAAPFVSEVGAAISQKRLHRQAVQVDLICASVIEPTYEQAGGPAYLELRTAMEAVQKRFIRLHHSVPRDLNPHRDEMERYQAAFSAAQSNFRPPVDKAQQAAVHGYWATRPTQSIPDTFFADAAPHTAAARMQRMHPPWWGSFLGRLQKTLRHGHPAEGFLLDELPHLRRKAKKHTLEATIEDWRNENNDRLGWYQKGHYTMLPLRTAKKAKQLTQWFNACAPGYLTSEVVRFELHAQLAERLAETDPWSVPVPSLVDPGSFDLSDRN
ncbi:MAG: hypothetical protein KA257_02560 [Opitutaceae bacterium]|nr:hypothetical protein [Opitutaceae bacterium]